MMRYLALKYPENLQQWYPKDDLATRAKIDEYLDFHHLNTRNCANLIFNTLFAKKLGVENPNFNPEEAKKMVASALKNFTRHYLQKKKFIMGENPTIADLAAFFEIQFLYLVKEDFGKYPEIVQWMMRMSEIPEVRKANGAFIKLISKVNPAAKF